MIPLIIETILTFIVLECILGFIMLWLITYLKVPDEQLLKMQDMNNDEIGKIFETYYMPKFKDIFIILNLIVASILLII